MQVPEAAGVGHGARPDRRRPCPGVAASSPRTAAPTDCRPAARAGHQGRPQLRRPDHARVVEPPDRPGRRERRALPLHVEGRGADRRHQRGVRHRHPVDPEPPHRHPAPRCRSTRSGPVIVDGVPVWPPYVPLPPLAGVAALTGLPADAAVTARPIVAVKIDNYVTARPQWGLAQADAVIEMNVEGVTRFMALFQTDRPERGRTGPLRPHRRRRPARGDEPAGVRVLRCERRGDDVAPHRRRAPGCSSTTPPSATPATPATRPSRARTTSSSTPSCATGASRLRPVRRGRCGRSTRTGRTLRARVSPAPDTAFGVPMDGVAVQWQWDAAGGVYRRFQDGQPHLTVADEHRSPRTTSS